MLQVTFQDQQQTMTKTLSDRLEGEGTTLPTPDLVHTRTMKSQEGVAVKDSAPLWASHLSNIHTYTPSLGTSIGKPLHWDRHCSDVQVPLLRPPYEVALNTFFCSDPVFSTFPL